MTGLRLALCALVAVLAACGDATPPREASAADSLAPTPAAQVGAESRPETENRTDGDDDKAPSGEDTVNLTAVMNQAAMDLAGRLGMGEADIQVFSAERVTWSDGSLGCPENGAVYTQALVHDGYRIIFTANGELHHYHGAGDLPPVYCSNPQEPYESTGS